MSRSLLLAAFLLLQFTSSAQTTTFKNIGEMTLYYKDSARNRPVTTEIWYPTNDSLPQKDLLLQEDHKLIPIIRTPTVKNAKVPDQKMPLILLSHGAGAGRQNLEWLADGLVKKGFIVAAVDHYGTTYDSHRPAGHHHRRRKR